MPRLSACLITLNEAPLIYDALNSLKGIADEIIVVDGGSTDSTASVARSAGATVLTHPWSDDFSQSRNVAIAAASGDWAFFLDSDEVLVEGGGALLRRAMGEGKHDLYSIRRREEGSSPSEALIPRLGRLGTGRRFVNRIHERIEPPFASLGHSGALVLHKKAPPVVREGKMHRYLRLLELELSERPDSLYHIIDRIHTKRGLNHIDWTDEIGRALGFLDLKSEIPPPGQVNILLEVALLAPEPTLPPDLKHRALIRLVRRWFPNNCILHGLSCWRLTEAGDYAEAVAMGERCARLWESGTYDKSHGFDPSFLQTLLPHTLAKARAGASPLW